MAYGDVFLYRLKGIIRKGHYDGYTDEKKVYYIEDTSFQKAVTRAKKLYEHIHSVEQINGEIPDES